MKLLILGILSVLTFFFAEYGQNERHRKIESKSTYAPCDTLQINVNHDSVSYVLFRIYDKDSLPLLYFRNIRMTPCKGDKCEIMNLKMYWDANGNFFKFELAKNESLTKLNHKEFTNKEYVKLHNILLDTSSDFRFLKMQELTERKAENSFYSADATSGATVKRRDFVCINGAVKTTYRLWHLANGQVINDIKQLELKYQTQLPDKTKDSLNHTIIGDAEMINSLSTENIYFFSKYLDSLEPVSDSTKDNIKGWAGGILSGKSSWNALLLYNFLKRNNFDKPKKQIKYYSKNSLIINIKP